MQSHVSKFLDLVREDPAQFRAAIAAGAIVLERADHIAMVEVRDETLYWWMSGGTNLCSMVRSVAAMFGRSRIIFHTRRAGMCRLLREFSPKQLSVDPPIFEVHVS